MKEHSTNVTRFLPHMLILLQGLLYGLGDPLSKDAFFVMPVYSLLSIRYTIALAALMLFCGKRIIHGIKTAPVRAWLIPSLCMGGAYISNNIALNITGATTVAFLRSLSTVMTPLLALAVFKKKLGKKQIAIQLLVVVGLYLLCGPSGTGSFGAGEVFALLSALLLAGSLVFGEKSLEQMDSVTLTALQIAASAIMASVCAPVFNGGWHFDIITPKIWFIILYLAFACTLAGYMLQNAALTKISSRTAALLQCFCPVMTAVFSFLLLGERLSVSGVIGACLIVVCVAAETLVSEN